MPVTVILHLSKTLVMTYFMNGKTMRKGLLFLSAVAAIALVSCAKENAEPVKMVQTTFTANSELIGTGDNIASKVSLEGKKFKWEQGDAISIVAASEPSKCYKFTATQSGETTEFTGSLPEGTAGPFYAFYPYSETVRLGGTNNSQLIVSLPAEQTAVENDIPKTTPFFAYTDGNELVFKMSASLIKFTIGTPDVKEVIFSGKNNEALAGTTCRLNTSSVNVSVASGTSTSISLKGDFKVGSTYYLSVKAPGAKSEKFTKGIKVVLNDGDGNVLSVKESDESSSLENNASYARSRALDLGEL